MHSQPKPGWPRRRTAVVGLVSLVLAFLIPPIGFVACVAEIALGSATLAGRLRWTPLLGQTPVPRRAWLDIVAAVALLITSVWSIAFGRQIKERKAREAEHIADVERVEAEAASERQRKLQADAPAAIEFARSRLHDAAALVAEGELHDARSTLVEASASVERLR